MSLHIRINNVPDYAENYPYIIARQVNSEFWFYGAFDNKAEADRIARELGDNAAVFDNEDIISGNREKSE